jgi:CheY-like chemotaxis protein
VNQLDAAMPPSPDSGTLGVMETLGDWALAAGHDPSLGRVRLAPPVAAALRAALDWLLADAARRPVMVRVDDTALEVWLEHVDARGLIAAGEVLGSVAGSLGRGGYGARRTAMWILRVPISTPRESYLMIVRGGLRLALPWPSVLHVAMARRSDLDPPRLSAPVVDAPGTLGASDELPVVLLGIGLKRAWLAADRLVWRLGATRAAAAQAPAEGLTHPVETEEDQPYWVIDPAHLLHDVPLPQLPKVEQFAMLTAADVTPIDLTPPTLDRMHVTRIEEGPARNEPAPGIAEEAPHEMPAHELSASAAPAVEPSEEAFAHAAASEGRVMHGSAREEEPGMAGASQRRTALVAEDSLVAAAFLTRLLEQQGFLVRTVSKAAPLFGEAARGGWTVALVDVDLPDGRGVAFLREVRYAFEHAQSGTPTIIALVRDSEDIAVARRAGISLVLRKPFDTSALRVLLRRAGVNLEETR